MEKKERIISSGTLCKIVYWLYHVIFICHGNAATWWGWWVGGPPTREVFCTDPRDLLKSWINNITRAQEVITRSPAVANSPLPKLDAG